jgi:hypothetical protein
MIDTPIGILNVPELEVLISLNVELGRRYQEIADDPQAEPETRQAAETLAVWRRARARHFHEQCAETERVEAAHERTSVVPKAASASWRASNGSSWAGEYRACDLDPPAA